ncbi:hypothetical protein CWO85_03170 [Candidatus Phytoplasma ziziphi]|uniref:Uncharacterized protein n=1 Tax=Ziziphus jujuba witches'-broom phytoplasma TaxID=135727 RepID=A0A660HN60_ZIZJU|nr:hypothetical protein [Candidatus Phytoplasma ziziphi]AYJ01478.1 hypothetical protein CWO85_03170 [Candidatus Phytoplasma ziziphi]
MQKIDVYFEKNGTTARVEKILKKRYDENIKVLSCGYNSECNRDCITKFKRDKKNEKEYAPIAVYFRAVKVAIRPETKDEIMTLEKLKEKAERYDSSPSKMIIFWKKISTIPPRKNPKYETKSNGDICIYIV